MSVDLRAGLVALVLLAGASGTAAAQGGIELGTDAALSFDFSDPSAVTFDLPVPSVRAGFMVTERISVEPGLGLNYSKFEDQDAFLLLNIDLGALYHFNADVQRGLYVRPVIGMEFVDVGAESASRFSAGAGLGTKIPVAERVVTRLEASYRHAFENDDAAGADLLGLRIGLSLFTR
jgi:hypothetical protein